MARDKKIKFEKVILASDHAGFKLKEEIKKFLIKKKKRSVRSWNKKYKLS